MDRRAEFGRRKAQCLSKADLSRKGSVDEDVAELVRLLNGREPFFTTSSCAGRILLLDGVSLRGALRPPRATPRRRLFVGVPVRGLGFFINDFFFKGIIPFNIFY